MSIEIVPKNYNKIFPWASQNDDNFLMFEAHLPPTINYYNQITGTGSKGPYNFSGSGLVSGKHTYKFLHPSSEITEVINHDYSNDSSTFQTAMIKWNNAVKSIATSVQQLVSGSTHGAVFDAPFIWNKADRRQFSINLELFAYTDLNADIYEPIAFFRKNSYPNRESGTQNVFTGERSSSDTTSLGFIGYPSIFKITGGAFKAFRTHTASEKDSSFYSLINMNVKYNSSTKFFKEGLPMSATLSLTFQEVINAYADNFLDLEETTSVTIVDGESFAKIKDELQIVDIQKIGKKNLRSSEGFGKGGAKKLTLEQNMDVKYNVKDTEDGNNRNKRYWEVDDINPTNTPFITLQTSEENLSVDSSIFGNSLSNTQLVKTAKNIVPILKAEATSAITAMVQKSSLYKKVDDFLNTDPRHEAEVKDILNSSDSFEPSKPHINEVRVTMKPSPKPSATPITTHRREVKNILRKIKNG